MHHLSPSQHAQCRRLHYRVGLTPEAIARFMGYRVAAVRQALGIRTNARRLDQEANGERLRRAKAELLAMLPTGMAADKWREVVEGNF